MFKPCAMVNSIRRMLKSIYYLANSASIKVIQRKCNTFTHLIYDYRK